MAVKLLKNAFLVFGTDSFAALWVTWLLGFLTFFVPKTAGVSMIWKQWTKLLMALSVWACAACDMLEYHPYDLDIDGETDVNREQIAPD